MATAVPSLVVGLIAGVYVDRHDRRRIMIASNLAQAVIVALIPFVLGINITLLFVAILVNAGVKQFFDPAYEALIPEIASDEELSAANAFLDIASFGSTAIGFAAAGLLTAIDVRWAFWIDSLTFVFSAGCICADADPRRPSRRPTRTPRSARSLDNLGSASAPSSTRRCCGRCSCSARRCSSRSACGTCCCCRWRSRSWARREFEYGIQEGVTSIGFVIGSLFMARYAHRLRTACGSSSATSGWASRGSCTASRRRS